MYIGFRLKNYKRTSGNWIKSMIYGDSITIKKTPYGTLKVKAITNYKPTKEEYEIDNIKLIFLGGWNT